MDKSLASKVMAEIKQKHVVPLPKWQLLLKDGVVWAFAIVGVLVGAVAIAITIHLSMTPLDMLPEQSLRATMLERLQAIPYFWLAVMALFLYVGYHNFQHTENGYKWKTLTIALGTFTASVVLGVLLVVFRVAPWINSTLVHTVPGYMQYGDTRGLRWNNPEQGRLAGQIIDTSFAKNILNVRDVSGNVWTVYYTASTTSNIRMRRGEYIRIVGAQRSSDEFDATVMQTWESQGQPRQRGRLMMQGNPTGLRILR